MANECVYAQIGCFNVFLQDLPPTDALHLAVAANHGNPC